MEINAIIGKTFVHINKTPAGSRSYIVHIRHLHCIIANAYIYAYVKSCLVAYPFLLQYYIVLANGINFTKKYVV